jgi:hypothetical protein
MILPSQSGCLGCGDYFYYLMATVVKSSMPRVWAAFRSCQQIQSELEDYEHGKFASSSYA